MSRYFLLISISLALTSCALFQPDPAFWNEPGPSESTNHEPVNHRFNLAPMDVTLGMPMHQVSELWGEPQATQTAGSGRQGNERWIYPQNSRAWGNESVRIVYFENGRVVGWETTAR